MKTIASGPKILASADGNGLISQAGGLLLVETLRITGLDRALSAQLGRWRPARAVHDPGKVITDLAVTLALGGDCLADIAMLRSQPELFGHVASDPTVSRLIDRLACDPVRALKAIRSARATARERSWVLAGQSAPGADGELIPLDIDATIVVAHPDKEQAAPTWKKSYGFHPMTVFADHGAGGAGEPLAIVLRPGNAGSNTAADHIEAARLDLADWPTGMRVLVRKERTHPGAQLRFTDIDGHRFTCFVTGARRGQLADLELRHRRRARCEDRIRTAKDTGLRNLPLHDFTQNQIWVEIVALACELLAWMQMLALHGTPARRYEPKRLRLRLFAVAGRLVRGGRRLRLRIATRWPWASELSTAITRLQALPTPT